MATYVSFNIHQRINFKQTELNKIDLAPMNKDKSNHIKRIFQSAHECTGSKALDSVRVFDYKKQKWN